MAPQVGPAAANPQMPGQMQMQGPLPGMMPGQSMIPGQPMYGQAPGLPQPPMQGFPAAAAGQSMIPGQPMLGQATGLSQPAMQGWQPRQTVPPMGPVAPVMPGVPVNQGVPMTPGAPMTYTQMPPLQFLQIYRGVGSIRASSSHKAAGRHLRGLQSEAETEGDSVNEEARMMPASCPCSCDGQSDSANDRYNLAQVAPKELQHMSEARQLAQPEAEKP